MQDKDRIEEQLEELKKISTIKAEITTQHSQIAAERKQVAELEIVKFQALHNSLSISVRFLKEQIQSLSKVEEPNQLQIQGHEGALSQIEGMLQQAEKAVNTNQGAFAAFSAMEETLKQKAMEATSRARGLDVHEKRAVDLASRGDGEPPQDDSAKGPIGTPQQRENASQGSQEDTSPPSQGAIGSP